MYIDRNITFNIKKLDNFPEFKKISKNEGYFPLQ